MSEVARNSDLPEGWASATIGELAEFVTSGSRNWSKYYADEGALFVRTQDIKHNRLSETGVPRVKLPEKVEGKRTRIHKGDLLITITGYIGRVAAIDAEVEEAYVSQSVALVRLRNPEYAKFIQYQLLERAAGVTKLEAMAYGLGRPVLNLDNIRTAQIKLAPLNQQKSIVAEIEKQFSRLDEAVANLKRVKASLKRYKAAVLKAAVEGRLVETEAELARREGRSYEIGAQLLQRILETRRRQWKDKGKYKEPAAPDTTDLPELPEGWVWASAVQACEQVVDCHNKTAPYADRGIMLVRTSNIRDGRLLLDDVRYVDQPTYEFWSRRCPPKSGDVLFTREAPMGEAAIIPPDTKLCMGQRMMLLRPSMAIDVAFLLYSLLSPVIRHLIDRAAVGSGVKHLRVGDVELLPVPIPPLSEQHRIVAEVDRRLSLLRKAEAQVDANLQRAERLRQSLLSQAFSGKMQ